MSCSRTQHGGGRSRTPDLSLRSPTLYHWATALPYTMYGGKGGGCGGGEGRVCACWFHSENLVSNIFSYHWHIISQTPPLANQTLKICISGLRWFDSWKTLVSQDMLVTCKSVWFWYEFCLPSEFVFCIISWNGIDFSYPNNCCNYP